MVHPLYRRPQAVGFCVVSTYVATGLAGHIYRLPHVIV